MNNPRMSQDGPLLQFSTDDHDLSFESLLLTLYVRVWAGTFTNPITVEMELNDEQVAALHELLSKHMERPR
jgi:hypothetical protein